LNQIYNGNILSNGLNNNDKNRSISGIKQINSINSIQNSSYNMIQSDFNNSGNLLNLIGSLNSNKSNYSQSNFPLNSNGNLNSNLNLNNSNSNQVTSDMFHNYSTNKSILTNTPSSSDNAGNYSSLTKNIIKQTKLHDSATFRQVGPQLDSTVNAFGKKYSDELLSKNKSNPKIGYYGKSRLTR
jgi:hypothetical protein